LRPSTARNSSSLNPQIKRRGNRFILQEKPPANHRMKAASSEGSFRPQMNPLEHIISVRELAEFVHPRGDLESQSSFRRSNRALEGMKGHKRIQQSRGSDYHPDVTVERSFLNPGDALPGGQSVAPDLRWKSLLCHPHDTGATRCARRVTKTERHRRARSNDQTLRPAPAEGFTQRHGADSILSFSGRPSRRQLRTFLKNGLVDRCCDVATHWRH
jgi:hypothetical protein